mmetsp:Transcript_5363/g.6768  ORF Transcript_5363/g.6768 Transcript_5363/m.6768 type:complete len:311 (+) Transcript_5363:212-1144(+)|eukprot:CAMPEP_0204834816 /NCGR_PEP_ID=MMETSP1346-20131115/20809_1 /ASSEMBLY_ACC=CAM_ASM_000771 /TAXON_ID=215587 /ORGANISM="Aplanochytrium stocchinoi, Strain GSBS06" /LENGTH=310 /DNA_ID=CAMNT_0051968335 /DNA_START=151 /DNA_END=1083 /DNA_ORIENTATION=+
MSTVEIRLDRVDRTYAAGETVKGVVVISTHHKSMSHGDIVLNIEGMTRVQLNARNVGLFEAFYEGITPLVLMQSQLNVHHAGKVSGGRTEFPFEFDLAPTEKSISRLYETYHGVYVKTKYEINVELNRGMLSTALSCKQEFIVEVPRGDQNQKQVEDGDAENDTGVSFSLTPQSLENVNKSTLEKMSPFNITGKFHRLNCPITEPITGEVIIDSSDEVIESIDVQLVRVETVAYMDGHAREATEVQNIQVGDGDVCRGLAIPIFIVFPRLFVCPTMLTKTYKVEFELNLSVLFKHGYMVTENFPIKIYRP